MSPVRPISTGSIGKRPRRMRTRVPCPKRYVRIISSPSPLSTDQVRDLNAPGDLPDDMLRERVGGGPGLGPDHAGDRDATAVGADEADERAGPALQAPAHPPPRVHPHPDDRD